MFLDSVKVWVRAGDGGAREAAGAGRLAPPADVHLAARPPHQVPARPPPDSPAERDGDQELGALFRRMQEHSRRGAAECKRLLGQRLQEDSSQ